jgi:hypothetical protein
MRHFQFPAVPCLIIQLPFFTTVLGRLGIWSPPFFIPRGALTGFLGNRQINYLMSDKGLTDQVRKNNIIAC